MLHQRYVLLAFVAAAILTGLTFQSATTSLFVQLQVPDMRLGPFNTTSLISILAGGLTFAALIRNRQAVSFSDEVIDELTKTTWPTKDETVKASTTVVFTTLFTAALLGGYDLIWKNMADVFLFTENTGGQVSWMEVIKNFGSAAGAAVGGLLIMAGIGFRFLLRSGAFNTSGEQR